MRRIIRNCLGGVFVVLSASAFSLAAHAMPITVTFNEDGAPLGQLDGTTFYQSVGIADFENSLRFGPDSRLPDDSFGITNDPGTIAAVVFDSDVSDLSLTWATSESGVSFFANVFDAANELLGAFFFDGTGISGAQNGTASFLVGGIARLEFHDSGNTVAIDTLSYNTAPVPEPGTLGLLGAGLAAIGFMRRRRAA